MIVTEEIDEQDLREVAYFYLRPSRRAKASGPVNEAHYIDDEGMPSAVPSHKPLE